MKKVLLGTTALVAAGAFAGIGAAQAQEDVMLGMQPLELGGYYNFALVSTDVDGVMNDRGHGFQQNIELEGRAIAELDNGLTAGIRIRINGNNGGPHAHAITAGDVREANTALLIQSDQEGYVADDDAFPNGSMSGGNNNIDEAEVFFNGSFGELHLGMIEGAGYATQVWAPGGGPFGGIKSSWFGGAGGMSAWGDSGYMNDDSTKILYFSPTFNGISFAVSYAPENTTLAYAGSDDAGSMPGARVQSEQIAVAASYSAEVMGGSFSANVSQESHTTEAMVDANMMRVACTGAGCDPSAMRYGASLGIDDISLGIAFLNADSDSGGPDREAMDAGIGWSQGPLSLGITLGSQEQGTAEYNITALNAGYTVGSGINIGARISEGDAGGNDFSQILLGTFFSF